MKLPGPPSATGGIARGMPVELACAAVLIPEGMYWAVSPWRLDPTKDDGAIAHELLEVGYGYLLGDPFGERGWA